ncbi:paraquat-inducible protein A [Aureococcus anophagefferens]|nr:paraquat-inducible protein A [Aureococcus anophagefferens]
MLRALALALVVAPRVVGSASRLRFEASNDYTTRIGHPIAGQLPWVDATHVVVDVARPFTLRAKGARSACEATT